MATMYKKKLVRIVSCFCLLIISCKKREKEFNSISYYNKVNEIDSIYRIAKDPELAAKEYKILFKEYAPKNQEYIKEYETYIQLSEQYNMDFGGKESLYKLIILISPSGNTYKKYLPLFKKYGIDSTEVKQKTALYKNSLNHILIDSLTVASHRDQEANRQDIMIMRKNDRKNLNLFLRIFDHYGYPSEQKVGTVGNDGEPLVIVTILSHLICLDHKKIYPKLEEYLKKGEIPPRLFALIIDKYYLCQKSEHYYTISSGVSSHGDSLTINRRRKIIGLPSLTHYSKIREDFSNSAQRNMDY
ncbi:hypothetical protein [uncultured Chryseobacterium sp.]|uniref:hypothetical protein n=1 Tax=uncultured Chryseobacterium sp. TaxID=259322 RepID=UPI0025D4C347|nr:hypothetical protein [uncultured Chryseobacterium sp.]